MKFEVRGKEFKISLVNNYVDQVYKRLVDDSYRLSELGEKLREAANKRVEDLGKEGADARAINEIFNNAVKKIQDDMKEISNALIENRMEIVEELLLSNDLEYDAKWWQRRTSVDDINNFIVEVLKSRDNINGEIKVKKK